jgi:MFS family permease
MWNKNNFLLWQGGLISALGDMVYQIGLGFWVLALTGSSAAMGGVMAAGVLPRALSGPFAGVIVDRLNRKYLIIGTDLIRGIMVLIVAIAAFTDHLKIPLIIITAVIIGLGDAIFRPAVMSSIPSITNKEYLVQINSAFAMNQTGAGIIGNALGGVLFTTLGAPLLFLINGISYLLSAFSEAFISIPKVQQKNEDFHFFWLTESSEE